MLTSRIFGLPMVVLLVLLFTGPVAAQPAEAPVAAEAVKDEAKEPESPEAKELKKMKAELERLTTEYSLLVQRQKNELLEQELAKQLIDSQTALTKAQEAEKLAGLRAQVERMEVEASLRQGEQARELADMQATVKRMEVEASLKQAQQARELADMQATVERGTTARKLEELTLADQLAEVGAKAKRVAAENALLQEKLKQAQAQEEAVKHEFSKEVVQLKGQLSVRDARDELHDRVVEDIEYLKNPLVDGTLHISDRRIPLNGPIFFGTANYITERIHYFNNQCKQTPIFIVIDSCPGGSVMQGYRIVKAIEASPAPVYVVVKSFAASMAAVITTLADHSYAYPNAIILHHQMTSMMYGNLTQQKEQLENSMEWSRRLSEPVAKKMGVSVDRLVEMMYEHNSDGDWEEFADGAKRFKWVNEVVDHIRETGIREKPTGSRWAGLRLFMENEEIDEEGKRFVRLPRLQPFDHYFLYNPDGYYR